MTRCGLAALLCCCMAVCNAAQAAPPWDDARSVSRTQIDTALREQQALGYKLDAIGNSVRLQVGVFLSLAKQAQAAGGPQYPLRVTHGDWFAAWLGATGLAASAAPAYMAAPHRHGEDCYIEHRLEQVLDLAATQDRPLRALTVQCGWPPDTGAPTSYSFEDRSTDPAIETTRQQLTGFRVLDYGSATVYDAIHGVTGRATSGLLGAVFAVLGHATALQTRFAIAPDGTQVSRTTARKGFSVTQAITINPDGQVFTGVPADRPDLQAIDGALEALPLRVAYRPAGRAPLPLPLPLPPAE